MGCSRWVTGDLVPIAKVSQALGRVAYAWISKLTLPHFLSPLLVSQPIPTSHHTHSTLTPKTPLRPDLGLVFCLRPGHLLHPAPCKIPGMSQAQRPWTTSHSNQKALSSGISSANSLELYSLSWTDIPPTSIMLTIGPVRVRKPWLQNQCSSAGGEEPAALGQGWEEKGPSRAKSQTLGASALPRLSRRRPACLRATRESEALLHIMCYFLPKNQGKASDIGRGPDHTP